MGQCGAGLVCFGLLALVFVQDCVASKSLFRLRRQIASWRWSSDARRQQGADTRSVGRRGSAIAYNQRDGVGFVGYPTGGLQPRQVQPPQNAPISVQCGEDRMLVTVNTDINGDGKLVEAADLTLGPQSCGPGPQSRSTTLVFEVGLRDCGNSLQMTPDWLIYSTNLTFKSVTSIQKVNVSAVVPIQCYYPRYGNVSSKAIRPTWLPFASTLSTEERLVFSLRLMTEDWSAPRSLLVYSPGDVFYIEASVETRNHMPLILYVDSCVATPSPEVSSGPRYEIIAHNGCLIDGTQEDSGSTFRSPRPQLDKLQFMVDAFWFTDYDMATIYITCSLRAAVDTKVLDPMNKACSYNRTTSSWSAVEGPSDICSCCDTQDCAAPFSQGRRWAPSYGRPRREGRSGAVRGSWSEDRRALASVGPLMVLRDRRRRSLVVDLGVGGLGFVFILICAAIIRLYLKKKVPP